MRISQSKVNLKAEYSSFSRFEQKSESVSISKTSGCQFEKPRVGSFGSYLNLFKGNEEVAEKESAKEIPEDLNQIINELRFALLQQIISKLSGFEISGTKSNEIHSNKLLQHLSRGKIVNGKLEIESSSIEVETFKVKTIRYESEALTVSSSGSFKTAKGKQIKFSFELSESREFLSVKESSCTRVTQSINQKPKQYNLEDPLVLTFDGNGVKLTDKSASFDLTGDGILNKIAQLSGNARYLSYDKNRDGVINNGSELFGPDSGNGFKDLEKYDNDKNGWIDENDSVFYDLKLWSPGEELETLLERRVGAIFLGSTLGSFSLKGSDNELLGKVKETGIWLNEDSGEVGVVQEIDMALR
jgi:hypothetical protein